MNGLVLVSLSGAVCPHALFFCLSVVPKKGGEKSGRSPRGQDRAQEKKNEATLVTNFCEERLIKTKGIRKKTAAGRMVPSPKATSPKLDHFSISLIGS